MDTRKIMVGHSSDSMNDRYTHLEVEMQDKALEKLSRAASHPLADCCERADNHIHWWNFVGFSTGLGDFTAVRVVWLQIRPLNGLKPTPRAEPPPNGIINAYGFGFERRANHIGWRKKTFDGLRSYNDGKIWIPVRAEALAAWLGTLSSRFPSIIPTTKSSVPSCSSRTNSSGFRKAVVSVGRIRGSLHPSPEFHVFPIKGDILLRAVMGILSCSIMSLSVTKAGAGRPL